MALYRVGQKTGPFLKVYNFFVLLIKSWTFWYIERLPMLLYGKVIHFYKWSSFFGPPCISKFTERRASARQKRCVSVFVGTVRSCMRSWCRWHCVCVFVWELYLVSAIQQQSRVVARSERDGDGEVYLSVAVDHHQLFHHVPLTAAVSATDTCTDVACQLLRHLTINITTREAMFSVACM